MVFLKINLPAFNWAQNIHVYYIVQIAVMRKQNENHVGCSKNHPK